MITLYGVYGPNVAKTRASLLLKGLEFEHVQVDLISPSDDFKTLTPICRVPVIRDNDLVVHDSLFIAEYLDRKYPGDAPLLPEALSLRVKAYTIFALLERMSTIASPLVAKCLGFFDLVDSVHAACSGYYPIDHEVCEGVNRQLLEKIERLAALRNGQDYFTGPAAMQADLAVFSFMTLMDQIGVPAGPLSDWMAERKLEFPFDRMFATEDVAISGAI